MRLQQGPCLRNGPKLGALSYSFCKGLTGSEPLCGVALFKEYGFTAGARDTAGTLGVEQHMQGPGLSPYERMKGIGASLLWLALFLSPNLSFPLRGARKCGHKFLQLANSS
jgi:hypothetical protein